MITNNLLIILITTTALCRTLLRYVRREFQVNADGMIAALCMPSVPEAVWNRTILSRKGVKETGEAKMQTDSRCTYTYKERRRFERKRFTLSSLKRNNLAGRAALLRTACVDWRRFVCRRYHTLYSFLFNLCALHVKIVYMYVDVCSTSSIAIIQRSVFSFLFRRRSTTANSQ